MQDVIIHSAGMLDRLDIYCHLDISVTMLPKGKPEGETRNKGL
jgi:hypothetical protein